MQKIHTKNNVKKLVVNADDFGLSTKINQGIIHCFENGIVTSASIMPNGQAALDAIKSTNDFANISFGWHLTLTSGRPISLPEKIPTLVTKSGYFFGKNKFILGLLLNRISPLDIKTEIIAQYNFLKQNNITPTHIDSHHDVHVFQQIWRILNPLARQWDIKNTRYDNTRLVTILPRLKQSRFLCAKVLLNLFVPHSKNTCSTFFDDFLRAENKTESLLKIIDKCQPGINLLTCHPGYLDGQLYDSNYYVKQREDEILALCSPEVQKKIKEHNIKLCSFFDLKD